MEAVLRQPKGEDLDAVSLSPGLRNESATV